MKEIEDEGNVQSQEQSLDDSDQRSLSRNPNKPKYLEEYELCNALYLLTRNDESHTHGEAIEYKEWRKAIKSQLKSDTNF